METLVKCIPEIESGVLTTVFTQFRDELDIRYGLHEKIVKLSRDITVESKKLIFMLHRNNIELKELMKIAETKKSIIIEKFQKIAILLANEDSLQFIKAYSNGLQEFIEAMAFLQFIKLHNEHSAREIQNCILTWNQVQTLLEFKDENGTKNTLAVPLVEYLLGLADITGEAMRMCINCAAEAKTYQDQSNSQMFKLCAFVRVLYNSFQVFTKQIDANSGKKKQFVEKMQTMQSSLLKCEDVCYTVKVRGREMQKHLLQSELLTTN